MPVAIETNANATAKEANFPVLRSSDCLYPNLASSWASSAGRFDIGAPTV